jgi:putative tryptophan/tyrosine transport system substrate-binding protein
MKRRDFIAGVGATTATPFAAAAQQPGRIYRIALLAPFSPDPDARYWLEEFARGGFIAGQNLLIDVSGQGVPTADMQAAADRLVKTNPDAIMTWAPAAAHAAQHATASIPIVAFTDDPIEAGLVASMTKPGGNTTGVGIFASRLDAKRIELLHELLPAAKRIGVLVEATQKLGLRRVEAVGRDLSLDLIVEEVSDTKGVRPAIEALAAAHVDAINLLASAILSIAGNVIIDRTRELRLPTIYYWADQARQGGLLSYGPHQEEVNRLHVQQAVRVLRGAPAGQLPVLQPTRFELVINLRTAKSIGLTVPQSLLLRADDVIE